MRMGGNAELAELRRRSEVMPVRLEFSDPVAVRGFVSARLELAHHPAEP
jgi:hypothetical protein